jgi:hypothetical protein
LPRRVHNVADDEDTFGKAHKINPFYEFISPDRGLMIFEWYLSRLGWLA